MGCNTMWYTIPSRMQCSPAAFRRDAGPLRSAPVPRSRQRTRPTREETRERILDGAADAFAERGFHGASQDDICIRVGLTRGALTSSFRTKDELFLALYDRMMTNIRHKLAEAVAAATATGRADLEQFFRSFIDHYPVDRKWHLLLSEFTLYAIRQPTASAHLAQRRGEMLDLITEYIKTLLDADGRRSVVDLRRVARLLLAINIGDLSQSFVDPDELVPGDLFADFGSRILRSCTVDRNGNAPADASANLPFAKRI